MSDKERARRAQQRLMTLQSASEELGVPYTTLRDLLIAGVLPRVQLGDSRRLWIRREDLEQLIANSTEVAG
jgi:excisionase family DNA binding protein